MNLALEQQLNTSLQELSLHQQVLNSLGAYIFMKDLNYRYTYVNDLVAQLFRLPPKNIIGHKDDDFFFLEHCDQLAINDRKVVEQGVTIEEEEVNVIKETGEKRYYWTVKKPLYDQHGTIIGLSGISTDITMQRLAQIQLDEKQQLLTTVLENAEASIYMKDKDCRFRFINKNTADIFGTTQEAAVGKLICEFMPPETAASLNILDQQLLKTGEKVSGEEKVILNSGEVKYYWSTKVPIKDSSGKVKSFIGFSNDITELSYLKKDYEYKAATDDLTQLANRREFMRVINEEFKRACRTKLSLGLIFFDIDFFKRINDKYGHAIGDKVLIELAKCCTSHVRSSDLVARLGGEEFAVLLPGNTLEQTKAAANKLREQLEAMRVLAPDGQHISITISAGVTMVDLDGESVEKPLIEVDKALYQAKNSGRNRIIII